MNAKCRTSRACSLSPPPKSIGDPSNQHKRFRVFYQFSAFGATIGFVELSTSSSLALPVHLDGNVVPRDFQGESCTHRPIPFRCRLSSHCCCCCCHCCPLIQALFDAPCTSFALPVRPVHLSRRAVNPLLGCSSGKPVQDQIGVRVCPVTQFNFFSTAFDPRAWTMVVFWWENSGTSASPDYT